MVEPEQPAQPSQPAASIESSTSNAAQSTPAPALKQDDSAYYTCKACGYHDWTAVDGGYKCDHCGYVESVKQIAKGLHGTGYCTACFDGAYPTEIPETTSKNRFESKISAQGKKQESEEKL